MMKISFDQIANGAIAFAALLAAAVLVRRELRPQSAANAAPLYEPRWEEYARVGNQLTAQDPKLRVIILSDFQCPACRAFEIEFRKFRRLHAGKVEYTFIHFPLTYHPAAIRAANAAECAGSQGRFFPMHDALFDRQDSLGTISLASLAIAAGIPDSTAFIRCHGAIDIMPRVTHGLEVGRSLALRGTPTVLINGWKFSTIPTLQQLDSALSAGEKGNTGRK